MTDRESADPIAEPTGKRRRRRRRAPVEVVSDPTGGHRAVAPVHKRQRWSREALSSLGISPIFRAYIFLGSIVAILAFLLYNESLTSELREQEKNRVDLYARLISFAPMATDEQTATIFNEVITKVDFPRIITNHEDKIVLASDLGELVPGDEENASGLWGALAFWRAEETAVALGDSVYEKALRRLMRKMDAENEPIKYYLSATTAGRLYANGQRAIITDTKGDIAKWRGANLPDETDTTAAALIRVRLALEQMHARRPLEFAVPAEGFSYLHFDGMQAIITDGNGDVVTWVGHTLPAVDVKSLEAIEAVRDRADSMGEKEAPLPFYIAAEHYIHYGSSDLINRISFAPVVQIGVLFLFLLVGYIGYRNIKRSEQRSIWVGMAKETAHQLGTPLSSLSGWLELMRNEIDGESAQERNERLQRIAQMVGEMEEDMRHLNQIASRFSQIGSVPELVLGDVGSVLEETIAYFRHRSPQFGRHDIRIDRQEDVRSIPLNAELMSWAFENLFKNALDAMDGKTGAVQIHLVEIPEDRVVQIVFQDDGRGIEPENIKRVFEPGFSTKKRGWGLGLAFVRRIVEEYHNGRISVVQSVPGEGTTFEIILPFGE